MILSYINPMPPDIILISQIQQLGRKKLNIYLKTTSCFYITCISQCIRFFETCFCWQKMFHWRKSSVTLQLWVWLKGSMFERVKWRSLSAKEVFLRPWHTGHYERSSRLPKEYDQILITNCFRLFKLTLNSIPFYRVKSFTIIKYCQWKYKPWCSLSLIGF